MREMKDPMERWLSEYAKDSTRRVSKRRFEMFLDFTGKTSQELVDEFDQKNVRHVILKFQNHLLNEVGLSKHTVRSAIGSVRGFYASQCQPIFDLRGKLVQAKHPSQKEHQFSINDLRKMYHVGNTREYIQRRGRVLRKFPGKKYAVIYDIIVEPTLKPKISNELKSLETKIVVKELRRYKDFARSAKNATECLDKIRDN